MARQSNDRQRELASEGSNIRWRCHSGERYVTRRLRGAGWRGYPRAVPDNVPEIPPRFTDPRPVLAVGSALWLIATVVVFASGDRWAADRPVCLMGLVVGLLGLGIFLIQRRGARRGDKGAQTGL
ncbi:DUF2530 domain-containing protein [Nocardia arthritidis]|uniref:DUF2530 domain-containing protein n=1 Tax=Nocardia arthritidis TaxID=228602 RepID=A0A6G9Y611_9NOCA|nr:DUF2530 domain-containing protein [Nocardia arthritidis]